MPHPPGIFKRVVDWRLRNRDNRGNLHPRHCRRWPGGNNQAIGLYLNLNLVIAKFYTCIICVFIIFCVLPIPPFEIITMKSYSLPQPDTQRLPDEAINGKADVAAKKWKTFVAILFLIGLAFLIIKLQQSEDNRSAFQTVNKAAKTPSKLKEESKKKEFINPAGYLKVKTSWRKNLIGETVLEGTLHNTAPLANLKDPVLLVTWLSKTNTVMGTNRYPLYEYLGAGKTTSYKLKVKAPSKIGDVKVLVESATIVK